MTFNDKSVPPLKKSEFMFFLSIFFNSSITSEIINKAKHALEKDFKPISDMRASGLYRMEIAKNLLEKCFVEISEKKMIGVYE